MATVGESTVQRMGTLSANINYYTEPENGGTTVVYPGLPSEKLRKWDPHPVQIHDMRQSSETFTLDTAGFQLVPSRISEEGFNDEAKIRSDVYAKTSTLLRQVTGATHVHPFSHIIRRATQQAAIEAAKKAVSENEIVTLMHPANFAHVDQSYDGARQIFDDNLDSSDGERLSKSRWGIVNVWRPIGSPVRRDPLAVCDARTVPDSDLRAVTAVLPQKGRDQFGAMSKGRGFEVWNLAHNTDHQWWYASEMRPDEVLMIKCFDSSTDGVTARRAPHSAFRIPEQDSMRLPPRQSIEVRCLVFWEDQPRARL